MILASLKTITSARRSSVNCTVITRERNKSSLFSWKNANKLENENMCRSRLLMIPEIRLSTISKKCLFQMPRFIKTHSSTGKTSMPLRFCCLVFSFSFEWAICLTSFLYSHKTRSQCLYLSLLWHVLSAHPATPRCRLNRPPVTPSASHAPLKKQGC